MGKCSLVLTSDSPGPSIRRAVFLDRDGVINVPIIRDSRPYPPSSLDEFRLLPGVEKACMLLKEAGFLLIVATNQPDVGRGTMAKESVDQMHAAMAKMLPLDRIEVCFDSGQQGHSEDRKPAPGMLLRSAKLLNLDLAGSFMVGDRWRDIDCGHAAGCRTVFIDWGYTEKLRQKPNKTVSGLLEAAQWIIEVSKPLP